MDVESVMIQTVTAHAGMSVRELFEACGQAGVQALPFCAADGKVTGRVTLKNVLRRSCLPEYDIEMETMLNSYMSCVEGAEDKALEILFCPIEP